jgi:hypothetical protein
LLTEQDEIWRDDGQGSWRRKRWSIHDRHLLDVVGQYTFHKKEDWLKLLPANLPQPFTNKDLAAALPCRINLAQKITYTLRKIELIGMVGKKGNALLYTYE